MSTTNHREPDAAQQALTAIERVLQEQWAGPSISPSYPQNVHELQTHLLEMIEVASAAVHCVGQAASLLRARICSQCPYQHSAHTCALRKNEQCALYQLAEPIM